MVLLLEPWLGLSCFIPRGLTEVTYEMLQRNELWRVGLCNNELKFQEQENPTKRCLYCEGPWISFLLWYLKPPGLVLDRSTVSGFLDSKFFRRRGGKLFRHDNGEVVQISR